MKYKEITGVANPLSRIILGTSSKPFFSGQEVDELIEAALESGINTLDTAREYGGSEGAIGRWLLRSGKRDRVVIISKCCHPSFAFVPRVNEKCAREDLMRSLDALETDFIDIYLLHRDLELLPAGKIVEFMAKLREEGKVGVIGTSNWSAGRIEEANAYARGHGFEGFSVSSPHYSLGIQKRDPWGNGCKTVTGEKHREEREFYSSSGMPVLAWASLCGGVFSGKLKSEDKGRIMSLFGFNTAWGYDCPENYERLSRCEALAEKKGADVAQIVLAWMLGDDMNVFPIVGGSTAASIRRAAAAADLVLTKEEREYLTAK
ncbi:MAG: aldo/keto reductase [Oscillospiraceae bacterium]|nr:aldo/keto reductase [Oscillospiraceae bacterium]